ncbi:MAG: putative sulfate exporter family transporter [Dysosmobacter sp.]
MHLRHLPFQCHRGADLPHAGRGSGLSNEGFGLFAGTAVNDTSSVTAAASAWDGMHPGANTLDTAAIVKMTRTLAIIPITLVLALLRTRREGKQGRCPGEHQEDLPLVRAAVFGGVHHHHAAAHPRRSVSFLKSASKFFIVMAMVAIGLNTDIVKLVKTGGKPIFMGFCCWVAIACVSLLVQHLLGIW